MRLIVYIILQSPCSVRLFVCIILQCQSPCSEYYSVSPRVVCVWLSILLQCQSPCSEFYSVSPRKVYITVSGPVKYILQWQSTCSALLLLLLLQLLLLYKTTVLWLLLWLLLLELKCVGFGSNSSQFIFFQKGIGIVNINARKEICMVWLKKIDFFYRQ